MFLFSGPLLLKITRTREKCTIAHCQVYDEYKTDRFYPMYLRNITGEYLYLNHEKYNKTKAALSQYKIQRKRMKINCSHERIFLNMMSSSLFHKVKPYK